MMMSSNWPVWILLLAPLVLSGCAEKLVPVTGQVTFKGKPLTKGQIWFAPDPDKGSKDTRFTAVNLSSDGRYELKTEDRPGIPPGWYKVVVFATKTEPPENPFGWTPDWIIPVKYTSAQTTDLSVEIPNSSQPVVHNFDLKE